MREPDADGGGDRDAAKRAAAAKVSRTGSAAAIVACWSGPLTIAANSSPPSRPAMLSAADGGKRVREQAQHAIAHCMAVAVVDSLELVEVEQEERD